MTTIVIDLDGTLNNCVHRQHLAAEGRWDEFHGLLLDDPIYPDVVWFLSLIPKDFVVLALTGRNAAFWQDTWAWLDRHRLTSSIDHVLMRPELNYVPDHILKPQLLEEHIGSKDMVLNEVAVVLEDRDKVVEAWRNYGLPCWQVRSGGY
jgi:hypothetical protein